MRRVSFLIFFLIGFYLPTQACECIFNPNESFEEYISKYPLIFYAEVLEIEGSENLVSSTSAQPPKSGAPHKSFGYHPKFRIIELLKGEFSQSLPNGIFELLNTDSICSATFLLGEKYLIYANSTDLEKIMITICNPGRVFQSQKEFEKHKRKIKKALRQKSS